METGPIVRALLHHKTGTFLVALQIAVSLAIIVNAMFIINARIEKMNRPTGMDVANLIAISIRSTGDDSDGLADIRRDLDFLRYHPDVDQATVINHFPLSGSGSGTGLRTLPDENVTPTSTARYQLDEYGLETLGANLVRGRNFRPEEVQMRSPGDEPQTAEVVIVTQALGDELFPQQDPLGNVVYWGNMEPATIIGIVDHMQGSWVNWDGLDRNLFHARVSAQNFVRYLVRSRPGRRDALIPVLESELFKLNRNRVIREVSAHEDIVARSYELDRAMTNILIAVIILLVGLTALVITGLASYFVSQRTKQIGIRRALGATRMDILRYFLVENWLITTLGAIGGCLLTVGVGYWLETSFDLPRLDWRYLGASILVLWVVSQFAAYWPARRATNIAPAVATRSV
ncbi:MAG: FtsX-like permease family protein [Pseudomonadales bacterium]